MNDFKQAANTMKDELSENDKSITNIAEEPTSVLELTSNTSQAQPGISGYMNKSRIQP